MSKETALQIAMRIMHRYANSLFDEHTQRGRQFMQEMSECLELERAQIIKAFNDSKIGLIAVDRREQDYWMPVENGEEYYKEKYKGGDE